MDCDKPRIKPEWFLPDIDFLIVCAQTKVQRRNMEEETKECPKCGGTMGETEDGEHYCPNCEIWA
jgi:ribosomal protein S27AE